MVYRKTHILLFGCFLFITSRVFAQDQRKADSLAVIYEKNTLTDTAKFKLLQELSFYEPDSKKGLKYAEELITLSEQAGNNKYLRAGYFLKGTRKRLLGQLDEALAAYIKSVEIARKSHHLKGEGEAYSAIADIYTIANNLPNAKNYYNKAIVTLRQSKSQSQTDSINLASVINNAGELFLRIKKYDSALLYFNDAKLIFDKVNYQRGTGYSLGNIGIVYANTGKNNLAEKNIEEAIHILEEKQDYYPICVYLTSMADVYLNKGDNQAALNYTIKSQQIAEQHGLKEQVADASLKLSQLYEKSGNISEGFKNYKKHIVYRDSLNNKETDRKLSELQKDYEVSQKQIEVDLLNQQKSNQKYLVLSLGTILILTIIILYILLRNNRHKQKAYEILNLQKQETDRQKAKVQDALAELQFTQKQLIQSAKMASLGELTAGIAHEIQNPLNFVNNFSELSVELLNELKEGTVNRLAAADKAEAHEIINVLQENFKKIGDHGKRADSIVKGMLQHSRTSTGKKELTDINALADEYLRLSYHGLRAKDKDFNVTITKDFDARISEMEVVPQDIGRVLLNLYNNAFYAVNKKNKKTNGAFKPQVSVTTRKVGNKLELSVRDNGIGIPQNALYKIFQPFFTTKPAGEGTGLGLSLSYDIIKAYGGELKVETQEGEFAEFIVQLPTGNHTGTLS